MNIPQLLELVIPELSHTLSMLSLYGAIALALLTCFFGFRLRQVWYTLLIFAVGGLLGFAVARLFLPEKLGICLLIGLGVGLLATLFTFRLYQAAMFCIGFFAVFLAIGEVLGNAYPVIGVIASVLLGVLGGILAARYQYKVVILITAFSGGWRAASLLRRCIPSMTVQITLILAACLIAAGLVFQFSTTQKFAKK